MSDMKELTMQVILAIKNEILCHLSTWYKLYYEGSTDACYSKGICLFFLPIIHLVFSYFLIFPYW